MDSFVPSDYKSIASAAIGGVNIFAGIISTLQNFLKVAELMEAHRIAGVSWGKLGRNISIELSLDPDRRVLQSDFLKMSRAEYDRLIEAGPTIDDSVIAQFNKKFINYEVSIPSICNGLDKCNIYKRDENIKFNKLDFLDGIEDILSENEVADLDNKTNEELIKLKNNIKKDLQNIKIIKKKDMIKPDKSNKSNKSNKPTEPTEPTEPIEPTEPEPEP